VARLDQQAFQAALSYQQRERRFGRTSEAAAPPQEEAVTQSQPAEPG
jgi:hypothetical protein